MNSESYRFKVGNFECIAVSDGTHTYAPPTFPPPAILLFSNAPPESLEPVLRKHGLPTPWLEWASPYSCLVVNTGKHRVLVDTGAGGLAPSTGRLLQNLKAAQIAPEAIDMVILTHGHPDHIGGNTDAEGKLVFPNARYIMWQDEWDFWTSGQAERTLDEHSREVLMRFADKNLPPIKGQLELVDREGEILAGISAIAAPGHTPGHMALVISSKKEKLLCISDVFLHSIHIEHPEWYATVDLIPERLMATRRRLLSRAATEQALVLAFHFPFPGLGYVVQEAGAYRWQPVGMDS
jgi:glyoxylase-like metal-dependent hydrolase (beta-lactamase superfamily II)